ncbi:MAG: universal stress protein [Thermoanaerobaculia bacterium]|nr:universal stress protein [Thermoanaerobaculia bacterium]
MYSKIYVPVDNSDHSNRAIANAVAVGKAFDAALVGCHVYAARMHDYRFKQMEYTLPEEYLDEVELERQRKIHDSLITLGLKLISESYLDQMQNLCAENGLAFEPRMMDGKHHTELIRDMQSADYDLVVMGALGLGRVRDSEIGSVCERVSRTANRDVWVVKHLPKKGEPEGDTILVGIDGSPQSFGALQTALKLAERFGKQVEIIGVYDPYLHYSVFHGIVGVLSERASKVFRFEEQNQLHEEIIDTGLAQIYQSHLDVAERIALDAGTVVKKTLLDGKAFQKILDHVRKTNPWLVVVGRIGVHSPAEETGLGSNAENLLRRCPCDVLLSTALAYPEVDVRAEESIKWTPEAEARMQRVPPQVKGIARTGILRLALEKGHSVVTNSVIDEAMERFMPKQARDMTFHLAERMALELAERQPVAICKRCGVAASEPDAVRCGVCGSDELERVEREMLERIARAEGTLSEEVTYDGRKLKWSESAKRALWTLKDAYKRRRAKARIEKTARLRKLPTVTLELAQQVVEEETGVPLADGVARAAGGAADGIVDSVDEAPEADGPGEAPRGAAGGAAADGERHLVARDAKNVPLLSALGWSSEAVERILRVPSGFMRDRTQQRIEALAAERSVGAVSLALVEEGIAIGRQMMEEMLRNEAAARAAAATPARPDAVASPAAVVGDAPPTGAPDRFAERRPALNEVGSPSALQARRAGGPAT